MRDLITNKAGCVLSLLHGALFAIGLYQRAAGQFHWWYEPIILQVLTIVDVPWLWLADLLRLGILLEPMPGLLFMGMGGCLQWFLIGYGFSRLSTKRGAIRI